MNARPVFPASRSWILGLALLLAGATGEASPVRVTVWDLQPRATAGANGWSKNFQKNLVREVAGSLRDLHPDVIVLQQVADWKTCDELARALRPEIYRVTVCSVFRDPHTEHIGQAAILSRTKAYLAWSESWREGDESSGFAFAALRLGDKNAGIFSGESAPQEWGGKLVKEISSFQNWGDNRPQVFIVAADLTSTDSALKQIGFESASAPVGSVFTMGWAQASPPVVTRSAFCEYSATTFEMDLNGAAAGGAPTLMSKSFLWLAGPLAAGIGVIALALALARRSRKLKPRPGLAIAIPPSGQIIAPPPERAPYVRIETEGSMQTQSQTWRLRSEAVPLQTQMPEAVKASIVANVSRWLKNAVVRRLLSDRAQLMETQHAAALKVLEVDKRLSKIERQIQQREQDYERRIDELLKELVAAKEENRELIRAKIALVKAEMEKARQRAGA
ncbi:MAG TPA: hypothetical protein VH595_13410 [Verrucomicrobiae bacterium]|nr:hypothetical protein [Verrucomicrobiae bacterium]